MVTYAALVYSKLARDLACLQPIVSERDNAVKWTKRAAEEGDRTWFAWVRHPWLADLQTDPDFQTVVAGMRSDLNDVQDDMVGVYQLICK